MRKSKEQSIVPKRSSKQHPKRSSEEHPNRSSEKHRSPFRYHGGKGKCSKRVLEIIRDQNPVRLVAPFLGGGSIEIAVADRGIPVLGFDSFDLLTNCWEHVLNDSAALAEAARNFYPITQKQFRYMQRHIDDETDPFQLAVQFFVINRASYDGLTLSGGFSGDRFTLSSIAKLRSFGCPLLNVQCQDFRETLHQFPNDLFYLDPPYWNCPHLYGRRGSHSKFPHEELAVLLLARGRWILSTMIRKRFDSCMQGFDTSASLGGIRKKTEVGARNS